MLVGWLLLGLSAVRNAISTGPTTTSAFAPFATEHQLMAIFGWATTKEAERYTKTARRKKMAGDAMTMLVRPKNEQKFPTSGRKSKR